MTTWWECYKETENVLESSGFIDFKSETRDIFKYAFDMDKSYIILNKDKNISLCEKNKLDKIIEKRKKHIPLQYIVGTWEFMDLKFKVGEGVLIPRDDTSILVEETLDLLSSRDNVKVIDLCSGSGCIAIALEKFLNYDAQVYGIEISDKAFYYMSKNIKLNKSKINAIHGDIFKVYKDFEDNSFDAIVSNPPYIKNSEMDSLQPEVKYEPTLALIGGIDGTDFYENICKYWVQKLKKDGILAFEIGKGQLESVKKIMNNYGLKTLKVVKDINDIERVIIGIK